MAKSDRTGKRSPRESSQKRIPDLGYYIIVTDTKETEKNYMEGLRDSLPDELQGRIVIKVSKAKTDQLVSTCKELAAMDPQYRQPWIIFDRDKVVQFDSIIVEANQAGIDVGWSNPCIEIWCDAYFGTMHNYMDSVSCCRGFAGTFERRTGQEYDKASQQIYTFLNRYGDEDEAIRIAERRLKQYVNDGVSKPSDMCPCTTVQHLVKEIKKKVEMNQQAESAVSTDDEG